MTTKVEKSIVVGVPVGTAYNQWTQFGDFPRFMNGITSVTAVGDDRLEWVAEIAGIRRQWEARILEQVPDRKVAWAATSGATNAGAVTFAPAGAGTTLVSLTLEYEPEGLVEKVGDRLNVVQTQAEGDLERFKAFIEDAGYATGAWRGTVNPGAGMGVPGVEHAALSEGDAGKAGVSGKAVAAGVGLAAAAVAGVVAAVTTARSGSEEDTTTPAPAVTVPIPVPAVSTAPVDPVVGSPAGTVTPGAAGAGRSADEGRTLITDVAEPGSDNATGSTPEPLDDVDGPDRR